MISRKKIILKSEEMQKENRNNLNSNAQNDKKNCDQLFQDEADLYDENVWLSLDQLLSDQITEITNKWSQIDDEIWGKIVCFERNRRIAKAYARSQVLSITGSESEFDGSRIGLNAFPNYRRDDETERLKKQIKSGFKLKIDEIGNIYIKRVGKCNIYISTAKDCLGKFNSNNNNNNNLTSRKFLKTSDTKNSPPNKPQFKCLDQDKPEVIFNMRQFLLQISEWIAKNPTHNPKYPPADFMERFHQKCIHCIQLVICEDESCRKILRHPCWIVLVNIVGLDLLWSRFGYSNMILLNHHQLLSLKSGFAFNSEGRSAMVTNDRKFGERKEHKNTDDLYYSGYMAKISNNNGIGAAQNSSTQNNPLKGPPCTTGAGSSSTSSSCASNHFGASINANQHHQQLLSRYCREPLSNSSSTSSNNNKPSQLPSLLSTTTTNRYNGSNSSANHYNHHPLHLHHQHNHHNSQSANHFAPIHNNKLANQNRRLFKSTTHLTSTGTTSSSDGDNCASSMEDLSSSYYHRYYRNNSSNHNPQSHYQQQQHQPKLFKSRFTSETATANSINNSRCYPNHYRSSCFNSNLNSSTSNMNYYKMKQMANNKSSCDKLMAMKKLSSSNIELRSGFTYMGDDEADADDVIMMTTGGNDDDKRTAKLQGTSVAKKVKDEIETNGDGNIANKDKNRGKLRGMVKKLSSSD